ncbi:hypothetical protein FE257_011325 [Aspergillus nanangensis]|uniref:Zn(2)-C6 fungal-type domain-containing protein n=1 Tax=Aspergillus nanangensis TaxID=2582783 RepID=A0AAD4CHW8_ASPNN|nr:hypothetical protein FE257_011325 [Aspergillus nanangensis]
MGDETFDQHDLDELLSALPACRRCRLNKRRCDTQLPSCQNCSKAGVEYVFTLLQRLQKESGSRISTDQCSRDHSMSPASIGNKKTYSRPRTSRHIGDLSCLSQSFSAVKGFSRLEVQQSSVPPTLHVAEVNCAINQETHGYLVTTYLKDIHPLFPFLEESLRFFAPEWLVDGDLVELDPRHRFTLELVYSITSHHILDHVDTDQQRYYFRTLSDQCHRRGMTYFNSAATDISISTLQSVTLAALHSLVSPQQGNCGQLIGLAARLAIDLHTSDKQRITRWDEITMQRTYASIYCIENQFATALDRPGLLPEPSHTQQTDNRNPQDILCDLYRAQSRFRRHFNNPDDVTSLSHQLTDHINDIEHQPTNLRHNLLAVALETRLLLHPNDKDSASRLLEIYTQRHYIRNVLSPQWAYRAGVTVASGKVRLGQQQLQPSSSVKLSGVLRRSLEMFVSKSGEYSDGQNGA